MSDHFRGGSDLPDKSFWGHVTDWFKVLLRSGIPALLIGLGWLESFVGGIWLSSSWNTSPSFWVESATGIMMIALGTWLHTKELKLPKYQQQELGDR